LLHDTPWKVPIMTVSIPRFLRPVRRAAIGALALALAACATTPPPRVVQAPPPPPPDVNVYAYPQHGQTAEQQDRDRYECYLWAKQQTGFDPSAPNVPAEARVRVVGGPAPGSGTAFGAVTGALLGAALGNPWHPGPAMLTGAVIGGAAGTAAEASQRHDTTYVQYDRQQLAAIRQQAANYKRAMGACLEGRGYTVH